MWPTFLTEQFLVEFFSATIRMATPLIFAGIGGLLSGRAGVLNLGLDGMMLTGAFVGFAVEFSTGNVWVALASALIAGCFIGWIHAFISITCRGSQAVSGVTINIFCLGLTSFLMRSLYGKMTTTPHIAGFDVLPIPYLSGIPFVGPILFQQIALVYVAFLLVPIVAVFLYRTSIGLAVRAVGEHPRAADTLGVNVTSVRYIFVLISGALAGVGGAVLTLGQVHVFMDNMVAGRGFIALTAVVLGQWHPFGALGGAMLFGAADALQLRLQTLGVQAPVQLLLILPYAVALLTLVGVVGKASGPAACGVPYSKEQT